MRDIFLYKTQSQIAQFYFWIFVLSDFSLTFLCNSLVCSFVIFGMARRSRIGRWPVCWLMRITNYVIRSGHFKCSNVARNIHKLFMQKTSPTCRQITFVIHTFDRRFTECRITDFGCEEKKESQNLWRIKISFIQIFTVFLFNLSSQVSLFLLIFWLCWNRISSRIRKRRSSSLCMSESHSQSAQA